MTAFVESLANSQDRDGLIAGCRARLDALPRSLPDHLLPLVTQVREQIDGLFDEAYPITLTHGDLSELNLLVDEHSGALTGVVDWAEASFLPFGFALYALEHALGAMYLTGWAYHENAHTLRRHFWDNIRASAQPSAAERERMKVARLAGILFRYGTPANTEFPGMLGLGGQNNSSLAFLQAFASSEME
ncbi:hypothetical protein SCUCBS95973_007187 [Sporothrix curviconia]|uniref:Aminoglycoside phosphotransferase domain-containing protein n=1 Tax=Sporothrix curviconia TaxID=1260050 RepID=A0ABP0CBC9_9PEZI